MAYVEVYFAQWPDHGDTTHEIKLLKEGGSGTTEITVLQNPIYTYQVRGRKASPIKDQIYGSEITFNFEVESADIVEFDAIFESNHKEWKVEHYYDSVLDWVGWLQSDNFRRKYVKKGSYYKFSLSATDGLANLKDKEFVNFTTGAQYEDRVSLITVIKRALEHVGHELDFKVQLGTWCTNDSLMVASECALDKVTCDSRRFAEQEDGRLINTNCYKVISEILKPFNCHLIQSGGYYWIINPRDGAYSWYYFPIDWTTLAVSARVGSDLRLDILSNEVYRDQGELQRIRPLETVGLSYRDRNLGDNLLNNGDFASPNTSEWVAGTDIHQFLTVAHEDDNELKATVNIAVAGDPANTPNFYTVAQAVVLRGDSDQIQVQYKLRCTFITMDGAWSGESYNERVKVTCQVRKGSPTGTIISATNFGPVIVGRDQTAYTSYINYFDISADDDYHVEYLIDKMTDNVWSDYDYIEIRIDDVVIVTKYSTGEDITFDRYYKITNIDSVFIGTEKIEHNFGDSLSDSDIAAFKISGTRTETWSRVLKSENTSINILAGQNIIENYAKYKDYIRLNIFDDTDRIVPHILISLGTPHYEIVSQTAVYKRHAQKEIKVELVELLIDSVTTTVQNIGLSSVDGDSSSSNPVTGGVVNPNPSPTPGVTDHQALTGLAADGHSQYHTDARGDARYNLIGQPNFKTEIIKTLSTGGVDSGTDRNLVIAAESGIVDDMIELTGLAVGDKVLLRADAGDTITVKHNDAGATIKILIQDDSDFILDEDHPLELILVTTNELVQVYDEVGNSHDYKIWYVDLNNGVNTNSGSFNSPVLTLQKAVDLREVDSVQNANIIIMTAGTIVSASVPISTKYTKIIGTIRGAAVTITTLTITDQAHFYLKSCTVLTLNVVQTGANINEISIENCNVYNIVETVANSTLVFLGAHVNSLITPEVNISFNIRLYTGSKLSTSYLVTLGRIDLAAGCSLNINVTTIIDTLVMTEASLNISDTATLTITTSFIHTFVSFRNKNFITVNGTETGKTGEWADLSVTTLTQSQIQSLNTTPITVVSAGGTDTIIEVKSITIVNNYNTAAFATATQIKLKNSGGSDRFISSISFVQSAAKRVEQMVPVSAAVESLVNTNLVIYADADASLGNAASTFDIIIRYRIVNV